MAHSSCSPHLPTLPHFLNFKVQLNMVAWQTERGALILLSKRGNFGTWDRSSASECASVCTSASTTQSRLGTLKKLCSNNITKQKLILTDSSDYKFRANIIYTVIGPIGKCLECRYEKQLKSSQVTPFYGRLL